MTIAALQQEILRLKRETDTCIIAHSYQAREILEIADVAGDSFALSLRAARQPQRNMLLCGVRFMAETVKLLAPEKTVRLANPRAGCPMAEQFDRPALEAIKERYPDHTIVAYINTTAELKTLCDVCVTSSSAVKIVKALPGKDIVFIPDCNLGAYVASQVPEKNIVLLQGGCPIHACVKAADADSAKERHPGALLLVHPECIPEVVSKADFVGSTSAIMQYAQQSPATAFIIGTEISIAQHLQYACPEKKFYYLSREMVCPNMRITTLTDLYHTLTGEGGEEIAIAPELAAKARKCIDEMIKLGG